MSKRGRKTLEEEKFEAENFERTLSDLPVELAEIPVAKINTGGRMRDDYGNISELQVSLTEKGLIQPIAVMKYEEPYEGFDYFLLVGGRRMRAIQELKWETVPARIYPHGLSGYEIRVIELEENIRRKAMDDAEYLKSVKAIHELWVKQYGAKTHKSKDGHSMRDTAKRLNLSIGTVSEDIKMAEWIEKVPELSKLKTKQDIKKAIKKVEQSVKTDEAVKEYEELHKGKTENAGKDLLIQSYVVGDFYKKVAEIPDETIDLVDLDIDFPVETEGEGNQYQGIVLEKQLGYYNAITKENYPKMMQEAMEQSFRILKDGGWCIIWFGREYFQKLQDWGKEIGFKTSWYTGRWCQGSGYAHTNIPYYRLGNSIQEFFYFSKGTGDLVIPHADEFRCPPDAPQGRTNPYQKPIALMREILDVFIHPGSRVVVPFAGSGHTLIAAHLHKCHAVGFDFSKQQKKRYTEEVMRVV